MLFKVKKKFQDFFWCFLAFFILQFLMSKWGLILDPGARKACIYAMPAVALKNPIQTWQIILNPNIWLWIWNANYVMVSQKPGAHFKPISNIITKTNFCCLDWKKIISILSSINFIYSVEFANKRYFKIWCLHWFFMFNSSWLYEKIVEKK